MKIEHLAIWVEDLERIKEFYIRYFGLKANEKYTNPAKKFNSYFLSFPDGETRIEIMHRPEISASSGLRGNQFGITHFAISLGEKEKVIELTERLRRDGYIIYSEPRTTGDGYFESAVLDPEGNHLEITV